MGLDFAATGTCDKCGARGVIKVAVTKLRPHPEMFLRLPEGWMVTSRPESGEMLVTCPSCPPTLVTLVPPPEEGPG